MVSTLRTTPPGICTCSAIAALAMRREVTIEPGIANQAAVDRLLDPDAAGADATAGCATARAATCAPSTCAAPSAASPPRRPLQPHRRPQPSELPTPERADRRRAAQAAAPPARAPSERATQPGTRHRGRPRAPTRASAARRRSTGSDASARARRHCSAHSARQRSCGVGVTPRHRPATTAWPIRRRAVRAGSVNGSSDIFTPDHCGAQGWRSDRMPLTSALPRAYPTVAAIVMRSLRGRERSVTGPSRSGNSSRPRSLHSSDLRFPAA